VAFATYRGYGPRNGAAVDPETAEGLAVRWRAVAAAPEDPTAWMNLAEAQAELEQLAAAERSLWTAVELGEPSGVAHGRLGFLLYAQHRDDEARPLLEIARERGARIPLLEHTLSVLRRDRGGGRATADEGPDELVRASEEPPETGPRSREAVPVPRAPDAGPPSSLEGAAARDEGRARSPQARDRTQLDEEAPCDVQLQRVEGGRTFLLDVEIEGERAQLIVDTGASLTVITRELADDLQLVLDERHVISAITANGRVEMATAVLDEVVVAGRRARELRVAVCVDCVNELADGLLGLDLQATAEMRLDLSAGTVSFGDCDPL